MKTIFSGLKPSGNFHLGNYLGAVKYWVKLQDQKDTRCMYCVVDSHAITVPQDPKVLRNQIREVAAIYIACGLKPNESILFQQSTVSEHAELGWVLNCVTPAGWMNKMTQFKDKSKKYGLDKVSMGLYDYPVLMAADILLYNTDFVPVGDDQKQHVEMTRDIAQAFNRRYNTDFFKLPEPLMQGNAVRAMSLKDGTSKMSKSDEDSMGCVYLMDDTDLIMKKFKRAKTDSIAEFTYDKEKRPEVANLLDMYSELSDEKVKDIIKRFNGLGFGKFKTELADLVIEKIVPIGEKAKKILKDGKYVEDALKWGNEQAKEIAEEKFKKVKQLVGLL